MNITCLAGSIKSVNKAKYLGIHLDNKLNFLNHIEIVETKVARSIGIFYKLEYVLPKDAVLQLSHSLVHSYFTYGLTVWGNTFPPYISKLHKLQTKPLELLVEVTGMKLLLLFIKL